MSDPLARLCIVVPVGPGDDSWPPLLDTLRQEASAAELRPVFVDGDPQPVPTGALRAPRGRAHQQNAAARATDRAWLWFLHADTRLTPQALPALRALLDDDVAALGWFRLRFGHDGAGLLRQAMQLNAAGANLRSRWLGLPFGDQGLVLPRASFERLGGFDPALRYGEDHALVWAARRAGLPLRAIDAALITSPRRYAEHGWATTTWRHLRLTVAQAWHEARR